MEQLTLRAWRVNSGLKINEVAQLINKDERTVRNWEKGITIPDLANIEMLASIYHTNIDYILLCDKSALSEHYNKYKEKRG